MQVLSLTLISEWTNTLAYFAGTSQRTKRLITSATGFGNRKAGRRHRVGGGGGAVSGQRNSGDGEVGDAGCGHGR